jgi:hypothetical protein
MERDCRKSWQVGVSCRHEQVLPAAGEGGGLESAQTPVKPDKVNPAGIVFGTEHPEGAVRIPGYNALASLMKPARDPSLSLIALSGIEPTGPVMVEVPLVLNNTTFTVPQTLAGWRIGFAGRYVQGGHVEPIEHSRALRRAFDILRQAGAQLVEVDAQRAVHNLEFTLQVINEIDALVTRHCLDALVSEDLSDAFHDACRSGYPSLCVSLEDGVKLRFYGARWSRDSLAVLAQAYRQQVSQM